MKAERKKLTKEEQEKLQKEHWYYYIDEYGDKIRDPAR